MLAVISFHLLCTGLFAASDMHFIRIKRIFLLYQWLQEPIQRKALSIGYYANVYTEIKPPNYKITKDIPISHAK